MRLSPTAALTVLLMSFSTNAGAALGDCAQPLSNGPGPVANDCRFILRTAVGLETCDPACVCDTDGDRATNAPDALLCLRKAVGLDVTLQCACDSTTTVPASTSTTVSTTTTNTTNTTVTTTTLVTTTTTFTTSTTFATSTTFTSSTTFTTTTIAPTTTTTIATSLECAVRFRLTSSAVIGGVEYATSYVSILGSFAGTAGVVACTPLAAGGIFQFNDNDASKTLNTGYTNGIGLAGPADLAECTYLTNDANLEPSDFSVEVLDSTAPGGGLVDATVAISSVSCTSEVGHRGTSRHAAVILSPPPRTPSSG